jgi:hypothetical protein
MSRIRSRSGRQRESKSGLGLPKSSFMPWVSINAVAIESARPIQPAFHSQILRRHTRDFGVPLPTVGPGTKTSETTKTIAAGITKPTTMSSHVGIVSCFWKGKDIERSTTEKGRWNGVIEFQPPPTANMALLYNQQRATCMLPGLQSPFVRCQAVTIWYSEEPLTG